MIQRSTQKLLMISLLAGLLALPAMAQSELPATVLGETIDVRVVNLEAVVTDKAGNRVAGLRPEDFRLRVDGEEVPLAFFDEIRGGDAVTDARGRLIEGNPALTAGRPMGTSYLVFLDDYFAISVDRKRVLAGLRAALPNLGAEDRMAIVTWNGSRLEMLSSWTRSLPQLERALAIAERQPALGLQRLAESRQYEITRSFIPARSRFRTSPLDQRLDLEERSYAFLLANQLERTMSAATATLRSFANPPGRKVMLILSGGWPFEPAAFVAGDQLRLVAEAGIPGGHDLYAPLVETANLLGYTLYPVDLPGLDSTSRADASRGFAGHPSLAGRIDDYRENEIHSTLRFLAAETGGKALVNGQRDDAFTRAVDDTRSFYWLGFVPRRVGNDQRHEISLEVLRPGLKLRSRESFSDLSRRTEMTMAVESMLLFGSPAAQSPLKVSFGEERRIAWGKRELEVKVTLPVDSIVLVPEGGRYVAQLELQVAALDTSGGRSEMPTIPIFIETSQRPEKGDTVSYETTLRLSRKPQDLVLALHDLASGETFAARKHLGA